jgi:hypothetical protein
LILLFASTPHRPRTHRVFVAGGKKSGGQQDYTLTMQLSRLAKKKARDWLL